MPQRQRGITLYLEKITSPADIKGYTAEQRRALAQEMRKALLKRASIHGGHFGPDFGAVEAIIALHTVFDSPTDKIVYDVSHQSYPHKMLTGRVEAYLVEKEYDEVSGYTNPEESPHDFFNVGHTSTSISLATGLAKARDLAGRRENIIAFIGDGSMSGGEALEGLNVAGEMQTNFIIIFNDNDQSIAENHGGMYKEFRRLRETNGRAENNLFRAMGLDYRYVADGNDCEALIDAFRAVKDSQTPVVVHIHTQKGKGYKFAEEDRETWHYRMPFDIETGALKHPYTDPFLAATVDFVKAEAQRNPNFVFLAAGTMGGIGLTPADRAALVGFLYDAEVPKALHGAKDCGHALSAAGLGLEGVTADTMLSAYLLHPDQRDYDLSDLSVRYLGVDLEAAGEGEDTLFDDAARETRARKAAALIPLSAAMDEQLAEQGEDGALIGLELAVSRTLEDMEDVGIAVDVRVLKKLEEDFDARVQAAAGAAYEAIGREVNLSSPKQLQDVLFDQLALPKTKKTKSGYTTNAEALADLAASIAFREDDRAIAGQRFLGSLLEHRDAIKLRQSVEGLRKSVRDGRIHTTYQQTVAATGRLSSTDPNLQNIHARTSEGLQIREAFVPGADFEALMTADYSQIEMRLMAAMSGDQALIEAFRQGADLHTYAASRVFGIPEDAVTPGQRSKIKAMSYGLAYGLSAYGLSRQLRIAVAEAQRLMDDYFTRFGEVRAYLDSLVAAARRDGYTQTILGRRRYLPDLNSTNRLAREAAERMALNAPIQGSAADIVKLAMVQVASSLASAGLRSRVLLQVHDELVVEVAPGERERVEEIVHRDMTGAAELSVPLSVAIGFGATWRAAAH